MINSFLRLIHPDLRRLLGVLGLAVKLGLGVLFAFSLLLSEGPTLQG